MASYRKRGTSWDFRITRNGKVVAYQGGFKTKREAELIALQLETKRVDGAIEGDEVYLYPLWQDWFELKIIPQNKADSTISNYKLFGRVIRKYLNNKPVKKITHRDYQIFINNYAKTHSLDNITRLNSAIRSTLKYAIQNKYDVSDFTQAVVLSGKESNKTIEERYIHSISDYKKLLDDLSENLNYSSSVIPYLLYIQLKTGLRFGEVLGLTWDCIDLQNGNIRTYRRYNDFTKTWTKPKTKSSIRKVPIDDDTVSVLKKLELEQKQCLEENTENMLFVDPQYGVPTNKGVNKHLQSILKRLGIFPNNLTSTGIRHTYASVLLAKGVDIWIVADALGHKNINEVTETYGHLLEEKTKKGNILIKNFLSEI